MVAPGILGVRSPVSVWETQHRLLAEQLEDFLVGKHGTNDLTQDQATRLIAAAYVLLQEHQVNKRGKCRLCRSRSAWRPWHRRPCTIYRVFTVVMTQPIKIVRGWVEDH